jgi:hypothetical protein
MTNSAAVAKLAVASAMLLGALTTVSHGYSSEQQRLCTGDAMRLCSAEIPSIDRITACMVQKRASLSAGCRSVFQVPAAGKSTIASKADD